MFLIIYKILPFTKDLLNFNHFFVKFDIQILRRHFYLINPRLMAHAIPSELLWAHILPQMEADDFHELFDISSQKNDHSFIQNFMIPAYQQIHPDCINSEEEITKRDEIVKYVIKKLTFEQVQSFLNNVQFPRMCCGKFTDYQDIWRTIIKTENTELIHMFITDCPHCTCSAYHATIDIRSTFAFQELITHSEYFPKIQHFIRLVLTENKINTDLFINHITMFTSLRKALHEESMYILDKLNNDANSTITNESCYVYDLLEELSNELHKQHKKSRWMHKQLRRFQKNVQIPGFVQAIKSYVIKIDALTSDPYDDYDYYDIDF